MSIQNIALAPALTPSGGSGRFFLPGASEFADSLDIGQIIQGKVLRGFEGNRYLVAFGKDERVVDSSIPLTTGEILYGRVVGVGERVELQRVYAGSREKTLQREPIANVPAPAGDTHQVPVSIDDLLQQYQIVLPEADRAALSRALRGSADSEAMGFAGAMLSKLGLPLASSLLESLYRAQRATNALSAASRPVRTDSIAEVVIAPTQQASEWQASSIRELANLLSRIADSKVSEKSGSASRAAAESGSGGSAQTAAAAGGATAQLASNRRRAEVSVNDERPSRDSAADHILNAQTGGVVSHRSGLLPLLVGGKLVEISFALFEQQTSAARVPNLQHRQIIFSLQTELLGRVDVLARVAGGHVRVQITTGAEDSTAEAAQHGGSLKSALSDSGWSVDEISYLTRTDSRPDAAVRSVIEHVISLDSLNRLV